MATLLKKHVSDQTVTRQQCYTVKSHVLAQIRASSSATGLERPCCSSSSCQAAVLHCDKGDVAAQAAALFGYQGHVATQAGIR
jgi:hypothetical protein